MYTKECGRCEETKSTSEFYKSKSSDDGISYWCRECHIRKKEEEELQREWDMRKREKEVRNLCFNKTKICYRSKAKKPWIEFCLEMGYPAATCKECLKTKGYKY